MYVESTVECTAYSRSCGVESERAAERAKLARAVEGVQLLRHPLVHVLRASVGTATAEFSRNVLSRNLVEEARNTLRGAAVQAVVGNDRAKGSNALESVGLASVSTEIDRVERVLGEDLGTDLGDGVRVDARIPLRRQLLLSEEIVHGGLVGNTLLA